MKLAKLFVLSSAGILAASVAHAAPQIYGAFYVNGITGYEKTTTTKTDGATNTDSSHTRAHLYDNGSRIGVRGSEKLTDNVDVQYRLEYRTTFDNEHRMLEPRDAWIGLAHKEYGTIKAGRMITFDPYYENVPGGQAVAVDGIRANNSIRYESPVVDGNQFTLQYIADENRHDTLGGDGYAVSVARQKDNYGLAAAYVNANVNADEINRQKADHNAHGGKWYNLKDAIRVDTWYKPTEDWKLAAMYQHNRFMTTGSETEKALMLGATKTIDTMEYYGQLNLIDNPDGKNGDKYGLLAGATKNFTSTVYAGAELGLYKAKLNNTAADVAKTETKTAELVLFSGIRF